jgi:DNA-binding winged helix-turn-helix (wHTH) protein/type II secretory pathway pseudopilin PulG
MNRDRERRRWPLVLGVAVAVLALTGAAAAPLALSYRAAIEESFRERSLAYVISFADSASRWLCDDDAETVASAGRFLLVGSAVYVVVTAERATVVDERVDAAIGWNLGGPVEEDRFATEISQERYRGARPLDVRVPLDPYGGGDVRGTVRVGIDRTSIVTRIRVMTVTVVGAGIALDVLVVAVLIFALGRFDLRRADAPMSDRDASTDTLAIGTLRIDRAGKRATLDEREVRLTPKQFALMAFLAADPGRVFSDRELVAAVWTASTYADARDVKQCVYLLRRRLSEAGGEGGAIVVNVPGFGYRLDPPVDRRLTGD